MDGRMSESMNEGMELQLRSFRLRLGGRRREEEEKTELERG